MKERNSPSDLIKVVLLIPNVSSKGACCKTLSFNMDYDDAL